MKAGKKPDFMNFIKWNCNILASSLRKIDLWIVLIVMLDILFYFLSGYLAVFWLKSVQANIAAFSLPTDIISLGAERASQLAGEIRAFYYLIIASFALLLIAVIFLASILKGVIWAKSTNTKPTLGLISRFLLLNLIWTGFWIVLMLLILLLVEPSLVLKFIIVAIILGLYFTNTLYALFMKMQAFSSIIDSIRLNIVKVHLFLLPYSVLILLFFIIMKLGSLLKFNYARILVGLILLIYAAVTRYYVSELAYAVKDDE